jgi:drug/metabolite transporter (DMT)-like permease
MPDLFAAFASVAWGCSDFWGGLSAKGLDVRRVGVVAQGTGLGVLAVVLVIVPGHPRGADLVWGVIAGLATAFGVMMLYAALAIGPMYVAASITAVVGASANALIGFVGGERPDRLALVGIPLAIAALILISASPTAQRNTVPITHRVVVLATGAGLMLGFLNACFAATSPASGSWPVATSRLVATAILAVAALSRRGSGSWDRPSVGYAAAAGASDAIATASIAYALQRGPLVLIGVLGSLFPVVTVVLARMFLHESMSRRQAAGLACAVIAVALIR